MNDPMPAPKGRLLSMRQNGLNLFLTGFLVLFLELACIRWFAANVVFLQFFTNVALIASFLGMSCGCLAAKRQEDWLDRFPLIMAIAVVFAICLTAVFNSWSGFAIDVGQQNAPQEVFFGTEYRNPDMASFVLPIELIAGVFFVLIALMFVGLGQVLGRAFDAYPNRVLAYTLNIGGSVAGILAFSLISFLHAPPVVWYLISFAGIAFLLSQSGRLRKFHWLLLVLLLSVIAAPTLFGVDGYKIRWSPYYQVAANSHKTPDGASVVDIRVNNIGHQVMTPYDHSSSIYSLIHLLRQASGGESFREALVIGAGSGNDINHALRFDMNRIDAVEIDPVIHDIGRNQNPDRPYQDPRVFTRLDDGRHVLRTTDRQYDLVVYALVDSLILHSGYANIRLESYLFTKEAFEDIRRVLKPGGVFVTYNYFRQGWVVERIADMAKTVFGCEPTILTFPQQEIIESASFAGFTMIIAGCDQRIASAFNQHGAFWLNETPPANAGVNGFTFRPQALPAGQHQGWSQIAPSKLVRDQNAKLPEITDDWPFLYVKDKVLPDLSIRSMGLLALLGILMVYAFLTRGKGRFAIDSRMFFLGAAFMLLETKAVVQMALLFGSTWLVNSAVFLSVLLLLLCANLYVLKTPSIRPTRHYVGLVVFLLLTILIPLDAFLGGNIFWQYAVPCLLALGPVFFAGVIFALSFKESANPDHAFGSNISGAVIGGLAENFSTLLGFRYLLLIAIGFYILSVWRSPRRAG